MPKHPKPKHHVRPRRKRQPLVGLDAKLDQLRHDSASAVCRLAASYVPADVRRLVAQRRGPTAPWSSRLIAALLTVDEVIASVDLPRSGSDETQVDASNSCKA